VELMRCDLHVHSWHSGATTIPVLGRIGRECYSEPLVVYERALRRGMDLVTLTDHDTIEGALRLAHLPNTFVSEEVTVQLPEGRQLHVNVFDITEGQHLEIQARRSDPEVFFAWLAEQRIPASVNHLFSALTGDREIPDLRLPIGRLPLIETLNGAMPESQNEAVRLVGRAASMSSVGGSDAHAAAHVARAFTTVAGARDRQEYLDGLRCGLSVACGRSGSYARLTTEVVRIFVAGYRETARELLHGEGSLSRTLGFVGLLPLVPLIPLVTFAVFAQEVRFGRAHFRSFQKAYGWPVDQRPQGQFATGSLGEPA
jgi:predicted metal-dependent phosphoesterase TrpH